MTNSQRLAIVRACLQNWLRAHAATEGVHDPILRESILIRNDFYCGRQFHSADHRAVWFIEEDELKIYDHDRQVVAVFTGDQIEAASDSEPAILKLPVAESGLDDDRSIRRAA